MNEQKDEQYMFVTRNAFAKPEYSKLKNPATIIYHGVIAVVKHTAILEIVPAVFPEQIADYNDDDEDYEDEDTTYEEECERFYSDVEEEYVIPSISLNVGQFFPFTIARITDDFVDAQIDTGWRCIRMPRSSVVLLTPTDKIVHNQETIMRWECITAQRGG